ncbi:DNA mismatch repair endonuclease MutL [uncultured Alistipes sp.]|jgi:DNA mismatch repair protein MutL|uniref:DNA mismatch repair endonuclease MutL n=2 Tax=Alistipes TaxID=239759 RepID=UPI0025CBACD4|nr:DNA mismatch repair endonuclease MutL [uncultured Alistipes sp.]
MADKIRLLPEVVANQIAAGEVVNRPASVVKEMMENAIDAGAALVKVNFRDGGKDLIQIVDDGCGMSPIDARMAFDRHATSKIGAVEDIYALHTFGFRGEALASIAAVSQVELRTRQAGDEVGTETEINGGQFVAQNPVMCPVGSQFFVRNLFYNVPARRRFLDKSTTSASQIKAEFQRIALCNPQIAFELYANDAPVYTLQAGSLAGRIVDVVGRHIKQNLLEVEADTSIARIEGYIGRPAAAKKRNTEQYLFVNGRFFKSTYLTSAILKAYEKLIPESCQPSYFLYLTLDPGRIDVNVHPQKTEVKFADEEAVWQIVNAAVRETLAKTGAVPLMDFDRDSTVEIPVLQKGAVYSEPLAMSNSDYNPFREEYIDPSAPDPNVDFTGFDVPYRDGVSDSAAGGLRTGGGRSAVPSFPRAAAGGFALPGADAGEFEEFESGGGFEITPSGGGFDDSALDFIPSSAAPEQQRFDMPQRPEFTDVLPLPGGYVAALLGGRFVVVDVRRARERILYEDYLRMLGNGSSVSQQLLFPERLVLSGDEYALLEENAVEFAALGFDIDFCGEGAVEVKGTPADMPADSVDRLLFELLQAFATPVSLSDVRREKIAGVMARSGSKGAGRTLSREEAAALLAQLADTGSFSFSPSGKAITAEITPEDLRAKLG